MKDDKTPEGSLGYAMLFTYEFFAACIVGVEYERLTSSGRDILNESKKVAGLNETEVRHEKLVRMKNSPLLLYGLNMFILTLPTILLWFVMNLGYESIEEHDEATAIIACLFASGFLLLGLFMSKLERDRFLPAKRRILVAEK